MQNPMDSEQIIRQATNWTFESDCSLLQWMKQIGDNMERRATGTNQSLQELTEHVKRTGTALDNVANSLTGLQYSQFMESRCHDDDDDLKTPISAVASTLAETPNTHQASAPLQAMNTFINHNLEMLRNCHEKYTIELEDSEDEDTNNNFIYQPKNLYNDRPLPHIYGSKLWQQNWHVGLCDDASDHSCDEESEAFSDSAGSESEDDFLAGGDTKSAQQSASTSTVSVSLEKSPGPGLGIGAQQVVVAGKEHLWSTTPAVVMAATSTSAASQTAAVAVPSANRTRHAEHNIFADLQNSPSTPSHSSLSVEPRETSQSSSSASSSSKVEPQSTRDIFANDQSLLPQNTSAKEATPSTANHIKRKPVNLFDDDDFNSLMTEIVDKANSKTADRLPSTLSSRPLSPPIMDNNSKQPRAAPRRAETDQVKNQMADIQRLPAKQISPKTPATQPVAIPPRKTPLNLFDSPDNSPSDNAALDPVAPSTTAMPKPTAALTKITAKSLFDDEDDGDDFLNVFGSAKNTGIEPQTSKSIAKTSLFDVNDEFEGDNRKSTSLDVENVTQPASAVSSKTKSIALFEDVEPLEYKTNNVITSGTSSSFTSALKHNLFDVAAVDVDLFGVSEPASPKATLHDEKPTPLQPQVFLEDLSDDDDWLAKQTPGKANTETARLNQGKDKESGITTMSHDRVTPNAKSEQIDSKTEQPSPAAVKAEERQPEVAQNNFSSNYANLFMDEPPDDDDFFIAMDSPRGPPSLTSIAHHEPDDNEVFFEPKLRLPQVTPQQVADEFGKADHTRSLGEYGGLHLFSDDGPPDDEGDLLSEPAQVIAKNLQNVFYDDFKETLSALQSANNAVANKSNTFCNTVDSASVLSSATQDNQPPSDDEFIPRTMQSAITEKTSVMVVSQDETDKLTQLSTSSRIESNKLPKLTINVHALLPNAAKLSEPSAKSTINVTDTRNNSILSSVCKNRVRLPANRRPSTRRGRQENYERSLLVEQAELRPKEVTASETSSHLASVHDDGKNPTTTTPYGAANFTDLFASEDGNNNESLLRGPNRTRSPKPHNTDYSSPSGSQANNYPTQAPYRNSNHSNEDNCSVAAEFLKIQPRKISNPNMDSLGGNPGRQSLPPSTSVKETTPRVYQEPLEKEHISSEREITDSRLTFPELFGNSPPEGLLFGSTIKNKVVSETTASPLANRANEADTADLGSEEMGRTIPPTSSNTPLFKATSPDDSLFRTGIKKTSLTRADQKCVEKLFSYSDNDDSDGDDLFRGKTPLPKVPVSSEGTHTAKLDPTVDIVATKATFEKISSTSLFPDDDDADDSDGDLFKAPQPKINQLNRAAPAFSLFGDDDDSDDFLSETKTKTTPSVSKKSKDPPAKGLFSDSESDGDLFGSKSSSRSKAHVGTSKTNSRSIHPQSPGSTAGLVADNPLADLLK